MDDMEKEQQLRDIQGDSKRIRQNHHAFIQF